MKRNYWISLAILIVVLVLLLGKQIVWWMDAANLATKPRRCELQKTATYSVGGIIYIVPWQFRPIASPHDVRGDPYCQALPSPTVITGRLVLNAPVSSRDLKKVWPLGVEEVSIVPSTNQLRVWPKEGQLSPATTEFDIVGHAFTPTYFSQRRVLQGSRVLVEVFSKKGGPQRLSIWAQQTHSYIEFEMSGDAANPDSILPAIRSADDILTLVRQH